MDDPLSSRGMALRFDDSLTTILSADTATGFGARATWRQLVDLMGRRRVAAEEPTIARLRLLRQAVPTDVRAASARALAFATPPAPLVAFFAEDTMAIAAPVLRTATLSTLEWLALLPRLTPPTRAILRHRRDLPPEVTRGLESLGAVDFVLGHDTPVMPQAGPDISSPTPAPIVPDAPLDHTPFVALGDIARGLPVVAEAMRQADAGSSAAQPRSEIAELVARIEAFRQQRPAVTKPLPTLPDVAQTVGTFQYATDAAGIIRWVDGVCRPALVGVSLALAAQQGEVQLDGVASGAYRQRSSFTDARLQVGGLSDAAGAWRLSGLPVFDFSTGRFSGYSGTARRPRVDETAAPRDTSRRTAVSEGLRQLVHELRTPTNAISGFAELIETQLLGLVPPVYRDRATAIREQAGALIAAIDDLDTAARMEGGALELRAGVVPLLPLLHGIAADLAPLAELRGAMLVIEGTSGDPQIACDDRAVERLLGRLLAALVACAANGERIGVSVVDDHAGTIVLAIDRPAALTKQLAIVEQTAEERGAPLLGTAFTLRLVQNLAAELGGALTIGAERLTLRLPAADTAIMGMATTN